MYAKDELNREKKHLKAYLKGLKFYKHRNKVFPVLTSDLFSKENLEGFVENLTEVKK